MVATISAAEKAEVVTALEIKDRNGALLVNRNVYNNTITLTVKVTTPGGDGTEPETHTASITLTDELSLALMNMLGKEQLRYSYGIREAVNKGLDLAGDERW